MKVSLKVDGNGNFLQLNMHAFFFLDGQIRSVNIFVDSTNLLICSIVRGVMGVVTGLKVSSVNSFCHLAYSHLNQTIYNNL